MPRTNWTVSASFEHFLLSTSERQVHFLAKLEPEEQVEVWAKAVKDNNGQIPSEIVSNLKEYNTISQK